jgi:hypothetical protein
MTQLPMKIPTPSGSRLIRNCEEALRFIDRDVASELRKLPRWTFAHELFEVAARTGKQRDLNTALRQLNQAVSNEGWSRERTQ